MGSYMLFFLFNQARVIVKNSKIGSGEKCSLRNCTRMPLLELTCEPHSQKGGFSMAEHALQQENLALLCVAA